MTLAPPSPSLQPRTAPSVRTRPAPFAPGEARDVGLWLVMTLCLVGSVSLAAVRSPVLAGVLSAGFWLSLAGYLASRAELRRCLWVVPPLTLVYLALSQLYTFRWRGTVVEPPLLGTDGQRFVLWANHWLVEKRHAGWTLFTFALHPADALGALLGAAEAGRSLLHLQMAVFGALAVALLYALLAEETRARGIALLAALFFAFALAPWGLASAVDTYVVTVFLFLAFLVELRRYLCFRSHTPLTLALVTGAALAVSLENLYLPLLFLGLFALVRRLVRRHERRPWSHAWIAVAVSAAVLLSCFGVLAAAPPGGDRVRGDLLHHVSRFCSPSSLLDGATFLRIAFHETIGSVVAQRALPPVMYSRALPPGLDAITAAYVLLLGALLVLALRRARAAELHRSPLLWVLGAVFLLRHVFLTSFAPTETILFSAPSVAVLALVLGLGATALAGRERFVYAAGLLALDVLLLVGNAHYLVRAFESVPKDFY